MELCSYHLTWQGPSMVCISIIILHSFFYYFFIFFYCSWLRMVLFYYISLCYTLHAFNQLHVIFFTPCRSNIRVNHLINLLSRTEAFLVAIPDTHASLTVILSSRRPDVDVVPLTLVHDPAHAHNPARLFSRLFFGSFSRKNDGETLDPWRRKWTHITQLHDSNSY